MTTSEPEEPGQTAPIELPPSSSSSSPLPPPAPRGAAAAEPTPVDPPTRAFEDSLAASPAVPEAEAGARSVMLRPASAAQQEVLFIPLAVNIGDGFKFGCGFFLAMVLAMLVGFVLVAGLFVLTGLFGLNLPISR